MPKRTFIILLIFTALLIIGSAIIFAYQEYADVLIQRYINKITTCTNVSSEVECYKSDLCEGIYDQDSNFKYCQKISDKTLADLKIENELCQSSSGKWYHGKLGSFCLCQNSQKFDKQQGCISK